MANEGEIKTDVDRLLDIVKQNKEISVDDAAKKLGIPSKTVESLSDLLEEEGMLHIKYKFTTAYLTSEMPKVKGAQKKAEGKQFVVEKEDAGSALPKAEQKKAEITKTDPSKIETKPGRPKIPVPPKKDAKIEPSPIKPHGKFVLPETENIDELIKKANEYISQGDFEAARQIYIKIKRIKNDLPDKFLQEEKKVEKGIVELNEDIVGGMDKSLSTDFSKKISDIEALFNKANAHIETDQIKTMNDLDIVEGFYTDIKELYLSLPSGFMEKKVAIQDKMLELYRNILTSKKNLLTEEFRAKSDKIMQLMGNLVAHINNKKIPEANKLFNEITTLYRGLPRGFLKEKTDLQNRILTTYQKLILSKEEVYTQDIHEKAEEIKTWIGQAVSFVNSDQLRKAQDIYNKITDTYSKLPEGFYDTRADLEMKMLNLHHLIVLKHSKSSIDQVKSQVAEIESLMSSANNYLNSNELDLAKEAYSEAMKIYSSFPEGFIETSVKTRDKIVKLYRDILSHETRPLIGEADSEITKIYSELLKLLVQIHDSIKKKQFDVIKEKYLMAYKLYHELPLSFLEKKTSLYTEIFKIYEELKLYSELSKLAEFANQNDMERLKEQLNLVIDRYHKTLDKYPEDVELFKYVHGKCLIYLDILKGRQTANGREVRDKIQEVSEQRQSPRIEKPHELNAHEERQSSAIETSMPGIHPQSISEEQIVSAREYLKKKYQP